VNQIEWIRGQSKMFFHVHAFDIKNEFRRRYAGAKDYRKCQRDFFNEQKKSLTDALIVSIT
jgi:hypothetical protein